MDKPQLTIVKLGHFQHSIKVNMILKSEHSILLVYKNIPCFQTTAFPGPFQFSDKTIQNQASCNIVSLIAEKLFLECSLNFYRTWYCLFQDPLPVTLEQSGAT